MIFIQNLVVFGILIDINDCDIKIILLVILYLQLYQNVLNINMAYHYFSRKT
jgi:hypothetical protein